MKVELAPGFARVRSLRADALLAYGDGPKVVVEDLASGKLRTFDTHANWFPACPIAFDAGGRKLFHSSEQLLEIDRVSGRRRALTHFGPRGAHSIIWDLEASPDDRTLLFLRHRPRPMRIASLDRRTGVVRNVCRMQGIWRFAPHWPSETLFVAIAHPEPGLWKMRLDGRDATRIARTAAPYDLQVAPDASFLVYATSRSPRDKSIVRHDLSTGEQTSFPGGSPSLSPDGARVAFMRSGGDLALHTLADGRTETIVRVEPNELRTDAGWSRPPSWSRDGALLWFSIVTSRRRETSASPEFVAAMTRAAARAAKRRKGRGRVSYEGSIEGTFWEHEHAHGLVDFPGRRVWMREGNVGQATLR